MTIDRIKSFFMSGSLHGRDKRLGGGGDLRPLASHCSRFRSVCSQAAARLAVAALLFLVACDSGPQLAPLAPGDVVLAFGDSLTHGTGAGPDRSYPARLQVLIDRRVVNAGVPGETTDAGASRLPGVLDEVRPRLLILCHGGNDFLRRRNADQTVTDLRTMIETARSRGIEVVLVGVPRPGLFLEAAPLYERLAKEYRLPYLDEVLPEILGERDLKSDTIHPNAAGYAALAGALAERLDEAGAI